MARNQPGPVTWLLGAAAVAILIFTLLACQNRERSADVADAADRGADVDEAAPPSPIDAQTPTDQSLGAGTTRDAARAGDLSAPGADLSDGDIADVVLTVNAAEIEGAKLAQKKSTNAEVKDFAQKLIDDHSALTEKTEAEGKDPNPEAVDSDLSRQLKEKADAALADLETKSGAEFDAAYLDSQVQMHQEVLQALEDTLIPNADDPQLKQTLQEAKAGVENHLELAKSLRAAVTA